MAKLSPSIVLVALVLVIVQAPILYLLFQSPVQEALGNLVYLFLALEMLTTLGIFAAVGYSLHRKP